MEFEPNQESLQVHLERLDLTTDINTVKNVTVRIVPDAGKIQYRTEKRGGGLGHTRVPFDPERHQRSAKQRAIRSMQEIAHANQLNRFVTLTFAKPVSPHEARKHWKTMKQSRRLQPFGSYLYMLEFNEKGDGLHIHALVTKETAQRISTYWTKGFIDVRVIGWHDIDHVCRYLGKDFHNILRPEGRRYYASRHSKPVAQSMILTSEIRLYEYVIEAANGKEVYNNWTKETGLGIYGEIGWNPHKESF